MAITEDQLNALDDLGRCLLEVARRELPLPFEAEFSNRLAITIPAKHPDVGDLVIHSDADEITMYIGELFHWHFSVDPERSLSDGTPEAVDFIRELLADRIRIRVDSAAGHPGAGSVVSIDAPRDPCSETERDFLWSGPEI